MAKRRKLQAVDVAPKIDASKLCATDVSLRNGGKIVLESPSSTLELDLETGTRRGHRLPYTRRRVVRNGIRSARAL